MRYPLEELESIALLAARAAGNLVCAGFRTHPGAQKKGRTDLVTEYDLASERLLRTELGKRTPELSVVAEEEGGKHDSEIIWYCDPIDGTTNFVHGHPFWAVSVGAFDVQGPLAGAVVAPSLALEWSGHRGGVAKRNGSPCSVSDTASLDDALVATGFPQNRERSPDNNFDAFFRAKRKARGIRRCGSAAIDLCFVADGTYDAYWERRLNTWDVAGGAAVVLAAGGLVTALDGGPPQYERGFLLVSNGLLHPALLPLVG